MRSDGSLGPGALRILVLAPTGSDALVASQVLAAQEIEACICGGVGEVCDGLEEGVGALLLTEEALVSEDPAPLTEHLAGQDPWSDIPIILLTASGGGAHWNEVLATLFAASGNLTLIERPCQAATLASAAQVALRARRKQYEARELLLREQRALLAASEALAQAREIQAAREALLDSERAARAEAEEANRLKDEFLATLSHELRTPLGVIASWSRVLLAKFGALDPQLRQGLSIVTENTMAQAKLISDLLDMSRIMSGKLSLEVRPTDLNPLLSQAVDSHRPAADAKGVSIELNQLSHPAPVRADPTRLQQVFWNLLSNAIKFTPKGGRVTVTTSALQETFEVSVCDTGEGIAADFLPHLFDRFRQADGSTSRTHGGLGIGLSIAKQLVEMQGGSIEARSEGLGKGAFFVVSFPAYRDPLALPNVQSPGLELTDLPHDSLDGIRALVVEDQPQMLDIVRRILEEHGAEVVAVDSGTEALERLRREPHAFDVLVSDVGMPRLDGYGLLSAVRRELSITSDKLPAIAVTAFARPEDRARVLSAGFQGHLTKPYQVAQLVWLVRQFARPAIA